MNDRVWPVRSGRYGVQQCIGGIWSMNTINCGYDTVAGALRSIGGLDGYRVMDRVTGKIFTREGDAA